jgi:hypothetical protein
MGMKIYNHLRHYTQTPENTKYHILLSLSAPHFFGIASAPLFLSLRAKRGNLITASEIASADFASLATTEEENRVAPI